MTKTICVLPWLTIDTLPDQSMAPCCFFDESKRFRPADNAGLESYLNSSELRSVKEDMLLGKIPTACKSCFLLEQNNAISPRQKNNENYQGSVKSISTGQTIEIEQLHLRLSNLCDLACRSCNAFCSTSWNKENMKLNPEAKLLNLDLFENNKELEQDVSSLCSKVKHLYISGGEPFMDPRLEKVLSSFLLNTSDLEREINIQTNLSAGHIFKENYLEKLKQIQNLYISVSIDGTGEKGDFIRQGLEWEIFQQNLGRISRELPNAKVIFTPTISIYNSLHILELFTFLLENRNMSVDWLEVNFVLTPAPLNIQILPQDAKEKLRVIYDKFLNENSSKLGIEKIELALKEIKGFLFAEDREGDLISFYQYTKVLDKSREQDTFKLFPELRKPFF